jgi:hypothetical protein
MGDLTYEGDDYRIVRTPGKADVARLRICDHDPDDGCDCEPCVCECHDGVRAAWAALTTEDHFKLHEAEERYRRNMEVRAIYNEITHLMYAAGFLRRRCLEVADATERDALRYAARFLRASCGPCIDVAQE